ncbi:MAG TPA: hypothetical protein VHK91_13225 [Flavisolibacter sp.]|nr:hypothetical protein [Flavisolibacter sp.]
MNLNASILKRLIKRKLATAVLVTASLAAFATLGDDGRKGFKPSSNTPATAALSAKNFSLRTGYNYKSNNLFTASSPNKYITLNTVVTYQKGNATYVLPLKKRVILDKIKFNPAH